MKTLRLLILFSLVILGAYVEDKANEEVRGTKYEEKTTRSRMNEEGRGNSETPDLRTRIDKRGPG